MTHLRLDKKLIILLTTIIMFIFSLSPALAQDVNIRQSGDNVSIGRSVTTNELVNGDAVAIGGNVKISKGANGNVVSIGGNVNATGDINGNVTAIGGNVTVDGNVNGEVVAIGGKVILKGKTVVEGQVSAAEVIKDPGVTIKGQVLKNNIPPIRLPYLNGASPFSLMPIMLPFKLIGFVLSFAIISLIFALYPSGVENIANAVSKDTWRVLVIGMIAWLTFLPLILFVIGIPLVIFLYIAATFLGYAGVTIYVGRKFSESINRSDSSAYLQIFFGMLIIGLIKLIPIAGFFIGLVAFWISLGAMLNNKFGTGRPWFKRV